MDSYLDLSLHRLRCTSCRAGKAGAFAAHSGRVGLPVRRRMSDPVPMGDGLDYSMRLRWFEDMDEDENRPYDMEEPNFFGLSIAYDPYMREVVQSDRLTTCGGDGGCNICGGLPISRFPTLFAPL